MSSVPRVSFAASYISLWHCWTWTRNLTSITGHKVHIAAAAAFMPSLSLAVPESDVSSPKIGRYKHRIRWKDHWPGTWQLIFVNCSNSIGGLKFTFTLPFYDKILFLRSPSKSFLTDYSLWGVKSSVVLGSFTSLLRVETCTRHPKALPHAKSLVRTVNLLIQLTGRRIWRRKNWLYLDTVRKVKRTHKINI